MTNYIRTYPSITAFARHCEALGDNRPDAAGSSSTQRPRVEWDMGVSYPQALEMALHGGDWAEGARDLQSVSIDRAAQSMAQVIEPAIVQDVTGGGLDIGEYLADSPECFFRLEDAEHSRPIVKIGVCTVPCGNIEAHQMMNHGRAIIALVEALELQQYSVELVSMFVSRESKNVYREETTIKQAGEPWAASTVAFALAHPAFTRRLGFRALESDPDCWEHSQTGYGDGRIKRPEGYDIFFPYIVQPDAYETPAQAMAKVKQVLEEQQPQLLTGGV